MTDDIAIEVPTHDDWDDIFTTISLAFHTDPQAPTSAVERATYEPERCLVARREGAIVGTAGIQTRRLSVPGAVIPAAHVTLVSVAPSARRQGVMSRFIRRQFGDIRAAGEPIAALWASEGRIYQRFGYGLASRQLRADAETLEVSLTVDPTAGRLREGTPAGLRDQLIGVYERAYPTRPGRSERHSRNWDYRLADPDEWRQGATSPRVVIHEGDHGPDGYCLWRVTEQWTPAGPSGQVRVVELVAENPSAYASLWSFVLQMDLTRRVSAGMMALDDPIQFMVNDPRRLGLAVSDGLWIRLVDLPAALAARRYAAPVDVVLDVTDHEIEANHGRWRVSGSVEGATCTPTTDQADLACDVGVLGAAYLGGSPLSAFAAAGRIVELRPGAVAAATTAFGWPLAPAALEVF